jgi:D-aspartate ligase
MNQRKVGAVIVGGEHPGLGVARSLGRRGVPVCIIDDQYSISQFSKYVNYSVRVKDLRDENRTVESVLEIGRRLGLEGWVLFPTRDETVAAFSRHRDTLATFFRVTTPDWNTVQWAWNKKNTYDLAVRVGIPVPHTCCPHDESELPFLYDRLPLAIKPAVKENFFYATGAKAWRAETPDELHHWYQKAAEQIKPEEIMVQEIIPGDGQRQYSYCSFFSRGQAKGTLIARRIRQHPREFGRAATYVESIELPEIEELSERFLNAIDYYGLVEIEYKQDPRDEKFKLLDVNARTWGFHSLGGPAGVDFPHLLYADQLGDSAIGQRGKAGVGWLRAITDVPTVATDLWQGELDWRAYLDSIRRTKIESVFCASDPLPSLAEILMLPYLFTKKYLLKSDAKPEPSIARKSDTELSIKESCLEP